VIPSRLVNSALLTCLALPAALSLSSEGAAPPNKPARTDRYGDPFPPGASARLGTVRLRHGGDVLAVAFSPDGKVLASGGADAAIHLWDVATGKELRRLAGPRGAVTHVLFSPDGKMLISARQGPTEAVELWDLPSGKVVGTIPKLAEVDCIALTPDGQTIAVSAKRKMRTWNVANRRRPRLAGAEIAATAPVAFSPDGKVFASRSREGTVRLRDVATGKDVRTLEEAEGPIDSWAFSSDGKTLAAVDSKGLVCWNCLTGRRVWRRARYLSRPWAMTVAPDGEVLAYVAGLDCQLVDAVSGKEKGRLKGHQNVVQCLAFSPDGKLLATGGDDHTIRIWDVARGKQFHPFAHEPGGALYVSGLRTARRFVITHKFDLGGGSSRRISWRTAYCLVRSWDGGGAKGPPALVHGPFGGQDVCFSSDGKVRARREGWDGLVRLDDAASGKELRRLGEREERYMAFPRAFSPDGKILAVLRSLRYELSGVPWYAAQLWDVASGKCVRRLKLPSQGAAGAVEFSPDGKLVALASQKTLLEGAKVSLWATATGKQVPQFKGVDGTCFAWAPDGRAIATAGDARSPTDRRPGPRDRGLYVWELATGKVALRVECPVGADCCAISPDGKLLAWGDEAGRVGLIDLFTGREWRRFEGHRGWITSLAYTASGKGLVSGSADTTALLWDVPARRAADERLAPRELARLWEDLASGDAKTAHRAIGALSTAPRVTVPFLAARVRPVPVPDPVRVRRLLADLDSDTLLVREKAMAELESLERAAVPMLRAALEACLSAEARKQIQKLLDASEGVSRPPARLRALRAVRCLELIGAPEAIRVLQDIAKGAPAALLTQEARASLKRLVSR
jgi:WD40 repeat protein